ncbi:MAG TPA: hypothetical protein VMM79_03655 [Longimicrobiales bacterium]|nr:hypothetical protein [Longimicrobiales bacterium]
MNPFGALLLLLLSGIAGAAPDTTAVQEPPLAVRADSTADRRAVLRIGGVLDDEALENAVASGLPLRIGVRVELWRDGFFDGLEGGEDWATMLLFEPLERHYVVRTATGGASRFRDYAAARAAIEAVYPLALAPRRSGRYYYTATLEIETLSLSDLEELERWLRGELGPAVSGERSIVNAMGEGVKRLLIRLLGLPSRRIEARSERFTIG